VNISAACTMKPKAGRFILSATRLKNKPYLTLLTLSKQLEVADKLGEA
jgi:hypothetical protein